MSDVTSAYDLLLEVETAPGSNIFVEVKEAFDVVPPSPTVNHFQTTHYRSPGGAHSFKPGMADFGSASIPFNYIPGSDTDLKFRALQASRMTLRWRVTYPNGAGVIFAASVESLSEVLPIDDRMVKTASVKCSGAVEFFAAAAPVNELLPSISGLPKSGEVLRAVRGQWLGGVSFTHQWRSDGTAINGATAETYTVQPAQVGKSLSVVVTAVNSAGSTPATSGGTALVVA